VSTRAEHNDWNKEKKAFEQNRLIPRGGPRGKN
jgi:hypothetical protein